MTLSFCHVARSSRTAIAILVSKRMTAVWQPGTSQAATQAAFRGPGHQRPRRPAQAATGSSLAQYLHLVAATGMSVDWQLGHVLVGGGSPKTALPRRFM